jgi:hypothetical protein
LLLQLMLVCWKYLQALLRGRFLRNDRPIDNNRPTSIAESELGLLRQKQTVSCLRYAVKFPLSWEEANFNFIWSLLDWLISLPISLFVTSFLLSEVYCILLIGQTSAADFLIYFRSIKLTCTKIFSYIFGLKCVTIPYIHRHIYIYIYIITLTFVILSLCLLNETVKPEYLVW